MPVLLMNKISSIYILPLSSVTRVGIRLSVRILLNCGSLSLFNWNSVQRSASSFNENSEGRFMQLDALNTVGLLVLRRSSVPETNSVTLCKERIIDGLEQESKAFKAVFIDFKNAATNPPCWSQPIHTCTQQGLLCASG